MKEKELSQSEALPNYFCGTQPTIQPWHGGGPRKRMVSCVNEECFAAPSVCGNTGVAALDKWNVRFYLQRRQLAACPRVFGSSVDHSLQCRRASMTRTRFSQKATPCASYGLKIPVIKPQIFGNTELPADPATAPTPDAALAHRRFVALTGRRVSECARLNRFPCTHPLLQIQDCRSVALGLVGAHLEPYHAVTQAPQALGEAFLIGPVLGSMHGHGKPGSLLSRYNLPRGTPEAVGNSLQLADNAGLWALGFRGIGHLQRVYRERFGQATTPARGPVWPRLASRSAAWRPRYTRPTMTDRHVHCLPWIRKARSAYISVPGSGSRS